MALLREPIRSGWSLRAASGDEATSVDFNHALEPPGASLAVNSATTGAYAAWSSGCAATVAAYCWISLKMASRCTWHALNAMPTEFSPSSGRSPCHW